MKKAIRKLLINVYGVAPEDIIRRIETSNCKAVSFDIFDTLLKRNVPDPKAVFILLEQQYKKHFHCEKNINELRCHAEARAAQLMGFCEVNLCEIYQAIAEINDDERKWLIEEEIRIEKTVCQRCATMKQVYEWCIIHQIPIILVSDMYLSTDVITDLLHAAGYDNWKHLYISCEERKSKANGNIFEIVLDKEQIKSGELIHIGDSLRGDYLEPRKKGIQAILLNSPNEKRYFNKKEFKTEEKQALLSYRIIDSLIKNNIVQYQNFYQRLGYAVVGPILYGYSKWLFNEVRRENIKKIFFLAREGYFLKRGFDLIKNPDIKTKVIQVSRKAVIMPRLYTAKSLDELLRMVKFEHYGPTIKSMLIFCRINEDVVTKFLADYHLNIDDTISSIPDEAKKTFFNIIKPIVNINSRTQERNLKGYLKQMDFSGPLAICDVGWGGTIQDSLQKIFLNESMKGFYVGKEEKPNRPKVNSRAFLFENRTNHEIFQTIMGSKDLFELFFLSVQGSASHYEYSSDGKYICIELPPEHSELSAKSIIELQDAACNFVSDFKCMDEQLDIELNPFACSAGYRVFINKITNNEIRELRQFHFLNVSKHSLLAEHNVGWYFLRPVAFVKEFLSNGCRALFLKSVFKIPLPYTKMIDLFRKFVEFCKYRS